VLNVAAVDAWFGLSNVTVPGPLAIVQVIVKVFEGSPSSLTVPFRIAEPGSSIVCAVPALTAGGWFVPLFQGTVTTLE
jgi:hypothetical protein